MGIFLLLVTAFMAIPLVSLVATSFSAPKTGGFSLENFAKVFTSKLYQVSFLNSTMLSLQSSLYGIVIALVGSYAITRFASEKMQNNLLVVINMTSNFAGMPLAFALTLMLGNTGMFVILLNLMGIDLTQSFSIYTVQGLIIAYTYFQVPLGIMSSSVLMVAWPPTTPPWKLSVPTKHLITSVSSVVQSKVNIGMPSLSAFTMALVQPAGSLQASEMALTLLATRSSMRWEAMSPFRPLSSTTAVKPRSLAAALMPVSMVQ